MLNLVSKTKARAFFAACLRVPVGGSLPSWPQDWFDEALHDAIWSEIAFHGIAVHLHRRTVSDHDWPRALRDRIADEARLAALWEETHRAILERAIEAFADVQIRSVLMKGTALAYSVYDDASVRRRGDSDLLIRERDLDQARSILIGLRFKRRSEPVGLYFQETWLFDTGTPIEHAIDLHWQPIDPPTLHAVLKEEEYFSSARLLPALCPNAQQADPVLNLIHTVLSKNHHETHGLSVEQRLTEGANRLTWTKDAELLFRSFDAHDWHQLVTLSKERGVNRLVLKTITDCAEDLGFYAPNWVNTALDHQPIDDRIEKYLRTSDLIEGFSLDFWSTRSLRKKWRLVASHLFASSEQLAKKYPSLSHWPVPLIHVRRLAGIVFRMLKRKVVK